MNSIIFLLACYFQSFFMDRIYCNNFALPFVAKKPIELLPSISVELIQISEQMNIPYAPKAAKIIEKAKTENKSSSEQAPPKEVEKEIKKQIKIDNQKMR